MNVSDVMVKGVKSIESSELVSKALSLMQSSHFKELPVVSNGKLVGLITMHSILTVPAYDKSLKIDSLMFVPPMLRENDTLVTALSLMKDSGVQGLPVVSGDVLVGFVSDYDVLKFLKNEFKEVSVNDLMNSSPVMIKETDNVGKAKRLLYYSRSDSLPVVNSDNKLIGVLREQDLSLFTQPVESSHGRTSANAGKKGGGDSVKLLNALVREFMSKDFFNVKVGESLIKIIDLMLNNHVTTVFVTDDLLEPVGILSRYDLISFLSNKFSPRGVMLTFSGLKIDFQTNALLTKVVMDHLNAVNYLSKSMKDIMVYIKSVHAGSGVRKFEIDLKVELTSGITKRISKVGYALRECLDEALTDLEKVMKKEYKKNNP